MTTGMNRERNQNGFLKRTDLADSRTRMQNSLSTRVLWKIARLERMMDAAQDRVSTVALRQGFFRSQRVWAAEHGKFILLKKDTRKSNRQL